MRSPLAPLFATVLALASAATAASGISVVDAWTRALPPVSANGAAYLTIRNDGSESERLLSAGSPAASMVHLHETRIEDGVASMRMMHELRIEPGASVVLAPGGAHLMVMGLEEALREGSSLPLVLRFEHAGEVRVDVPVLAPDARGPR